MQAIVNAIISCLNYINPFHEDFMLKGLFSFLSDAFKNVLFSLGDVLSSLGNMLNYINPFHENFMLKGLFSFLSDVFKDVLFSIGDIINFLNPFSEDFFGYKIANIFSDIFKFLFIPKQESLDALVVKVTDKFSFIDSIKIAVSSIKDMLLNINHGTAVFDLDINCPWFSGNVVVFDLAWYKPFKNYGDLVFTGFAYIAFLWRVFRNLPSIISGISIGGGYIDF